MKPATVIVSGPPGAGKTTLARPLAASLGFALLSKDDIKERLHDMLPGPEGDLAWSRQLGAASMELMWKLAPGCPQVVLEAPFRHGHEREREMLDSLPGPLIEIFCQCPLSVCMERFTTRLRHRVHVLQQVPVELLKECDLPMGLGRVITVDTTQPVDIARLAANVLALAGVLEDV